MVVSSGDVDSIRLFFDFKIVFQALGKLCTSFCLLKIPCPSLVVSLTSLVWKCSYMYPGIARDTFSIRVSIHSVSRLTVNKDELLAYYILVVLANKIENCDSQFLSI